MLMNDQPSISIMIKVDIKNLTPIKQLITHESLRVSNKDYHYYWRFIDAASGKAQLVKHDFFFFSEQPRNSTWLYLK